MIAVEKRTTIMWAAAGTAAIIFGAAAIWAYRMGGTEGSQWSGFDPFGPTIHRTHVPASAGPDLVVVAKPFDLPEGPLGIRAYPLTADSSVKLIVDHGPPAPLTVEKAPAVAPAKVDRAPVPAVKKKSTVKPAGRARFHIIGGCFSMEENAQRFLDELKAKGYSAQRLPQYGDLHPVAFGSFVKREDALKELDAMKQKGVTAAWLLVR